MDRREFLKFAGIGGALLYTSSWLTSCGHGGGNPPPPPVQGSKKPLTVPSFNGGLFGYYKPQGSTTTITAKSVSLQVLDNASTNMFAYHMNDGQNDYYNPILILRKGDQFNVDFNNQIGEKSIIHWHGFRVDWQQDGHPYYAVDNGGTYNYRINQIIDRSGTYFYHPHPHGRTGYQVYKGLGGMVIIEDGDEDNLKQALQLEYGKTDIPLILQDRDFNSDGSLSYNPTGMLGFWGGTLLVNMTLNPYLEVDRRIYRFRVLNASNARAYRLVLEKGGQRQRFWVIGVEGGLLDKPYEVSEFLVSPGERIDILVDFRSAQVGETLLMRSLAPTGLVPSGRMAQVANREFDVLEFRVTKDINYTAQIPNQLSTVNPINTTGAQTISMSLDVSNMQFTIAGKEWDNNNALADYGYTFNNGDIRIIEFTNNTRVYHPMHLHGLQFQVISRSNSPTIISSLYLQGKSVMATDLGWKDTVIVAPNETVRIAVDFSHNFTQAQVYLLHCHILEHHDDGMMINYRIKA